MKIVLWLFVIAIVFVGSVFSAEATETTLVARMGMQSRATYHYVEAWQTRGKWIFPDAYYIDFGRSNYRELGIGGGYIFYSGKYFTFAEEVYLDQAVGKASGRATYLLPWTFIGYAVPKTKLIGQTVYFPYLPLNKQGRLQHVWERSKLEWDFKHFRLGGGYGAYQFGDGQWQHKPFVTTTLKTKTLGSLELWLQKLPGNHVQVQIRYAVSWKGRKP